MSPWIVRLLLALLPCAAGAETLELVDWQGLRVDPALSDDGRAALAWPDITANPTVTAIGIPTDWSAFRTLSFSVHSAAPTDSLITLVITSENPDTEGSDYYSFTFRTDFAGWRRYRVPLALFSRVRQPLGWERVDRCFFSANWAHRLDPATNLHLTAVTLDSEGVEGTEPQPGELLVNRSFEIDTNADGAPDGWSGGPYEGAGEVARDAAVAHSGEASLRIVSVRGGRGGATMGFGEALTDPRQLYLLAAWVRKEGPCDEGHQTSARITSVGADGQVLKSDYRATAPGPHDWRRYEWLVELPPGTVRFNLVLFHHGEGTAWWDDVSLRRVTPLPAISPAHDGTVPEARPTLAWQAVDGEARLEISEGSDFAPETTRVYAVSAGRFTLPEPLASGRRWWWRVLVTTPDGGLAMTCRPPGERPAALSVFYAGAWEERMRPLAERLARARAELDRLRELADRNGMWDRFSVLEAAVAEGERLLAAEPADAGAALAAFDERWAELEPLLAWWQRIFLDDAGLFADLDLDRPGLEQVKAAVAQGDWPAARLALRDYYRNRARPSWYAKYERRPRPNPLKPEPRADQYLTHRMPIHSYPEPTFDLGPAFDWHVCPIVDIEWPTALHRCFHWSTIAAAYWATGREEYAAEIRRQLLDFAQDNPLEKWDRERFRWAWSTLNATIRIYSSWLDSWLQVRGSDAWTPDAQFVLLTELREHGRFLMANHATVGNWVIAEARGLVELGILFPEFREARAWLEEGFRRLHVELGQQVLADGVHAERTPGYHSMVIGCFLEPLRLALLNQIEVADLQTFIAKIEQMHEYYLYGGKPNHRMEQIGDADMMGIDGQLQRGWEMFRRLDMQWVRTAGGEGEPPVHRSYGFEAAGQYVSRSAWNDPQALWSLVDFGGFYGHCHEDMGHLSLYAYGADLLVDTGRYAYAWPLRAPFYQTVGHNTVLVDGQTQKRRDALERRWITTDQFDVVRGRHDNSEPLVHERVVAFRQPGADGPGYWFVYDRLDGEGEHRLQQRWHTTEKLRASLRGTNIVLTAREGQDEQPSLVIAPLPQEGLAAEVAAGRVSYAWYQAVDVDVAQFSVQRAVPARFVTVLYPTPPGGAPAEVTVEELPVSVAGATAVAVQIRGGDRQYQDFWLVNPDGGAVRVGEVETDARLAYRRSGVPERWFLTEGSRLRFGDRTLFEAATAVDGAGATITPEATALVCTAGDGIRCSTLGLVTLNGEPVEPPREGELAVLGRVEPPPVGAPPRAPGGPRVAIEPPPAPPEATGVARMLPPESERPAEAVVIQAEDFVDQGGGVVEVTAAKVGAEGRAFLHWDRAGHWLEWRAAVPAGRYHLWLRGCTAEVSATRRLSVNGLVPPGCERVEFLGTGGYSGERDDWRTFVVAGPGDEPVRLDLPDGPVAIRLENVDGASLNVDWLALIPVR